MNYLAIDLGNKRCGLAYTNMGFIFTLPCIDRVKLVLELKKLILEKEISNIIVGLPYDLYGINLIQLEKTKKFISKLKNIFPNIIINEIDERFTTFESLNILSDLKEKDIMKKKDSLSAYLILERFLNKK